MVYSLTYPLLYFTPVTIIELPSTLTQLYSLVVLLHLITKLSRMQKKMLRAKSTPLVHTPMVRPTTLSLKSLLIIVSRPLRSSAGYRCHWREREREREREGQYMHQQQ